LLATFTINAQPFYSHSSGLCQSASGQAKVSKKIVGEVFLQVVMSMLTCKLQPTV